MHSTLVLNVTEEPLNITSSSSALLKIYKGKATAVEMSPHSFTLHNGELVVIPYVIRMNYFIKPHRDKYAPIAWSRSGVLYRDNHICAYCGGYANTIDHIYPQALGGKDTYENTVAACQVCNGKKADKTIKQLGWEEPILPATPRNTYKNIKVRGNHPAVETWEPYLDRYGILVKP